MNLIQPKKLLLSKWTAMQPQAKEKHFLVTRVISAAPDPALLGKSKKLLQQTLMVEAVELEAVMSRRCQRMDWRELQDAGRWRQGWL